jgi:hypothetical protein
MLSYADAATRNEPGISAFPETDAGMDKAEVIMFKCLEQAIGEVENGGGY